MYIYIYVYVCIYIYIYVCIDKIDRVQGSGSTIKGSYRKSCCRLAGRRCPMAEPRMPAASKTRWLKASGEELTCQGFGAYHPTSSNYFEHLTSRDPKPLIYTDTSAGLR